VHIAHTGPTALDAALDYRPNVVLLDIGLPGMDGFEVARKVREELQPGNVVLVAMTGYGQDADRRRSEEAGFHHHLVKPTDFSKVKQILSAVSQGAA
jgi:CheY-like chemotaxis protein